tara:strand:- start:1247 stop:1468 length:222 start_codon:yes stop_codon:yes gene_type:complete
MISEEKDPMDVIRAVMAEHSINFAFAIIDEDGDLRYDYSNWRVGRMLFNDSISDIESEINMGEWTEYEGEDYE